LINSGRPLDGVDLSIGKYHFLNWADVCLMVVASGVGAVVVGDGTESI
jgi:hypothetical protein